MSIQEKITAQANIDWSHPLLHIQFEQLNSNNPPSVNSVKAPVVWNGDVYALGRDHLNRGSLLKYSITHNKWSITLVPSEIYTPYSVLTTYLSELILISAQNRTIWEFDCNNDVFKESCIDPVPGPKDSFVATSQDNYLIIAPEMYGMFLFDDDDDHVVSVYIFDGTSWSAQQYDLTSLSSGSNVKWTTIIGNRTIFVVESDDDGRVTILYKAPLLLGECKDSMKILMCNRMDEIDCLWRYPGQRSLLLLNNQLFLADSQGVICTTYIQPPIEVVWIFVDSGISFRQAPHIVRLPNGEWLMVGIIIHCDHEDLDDQSVINSQLDVISVHHKVTEYDPYDQLTVRALINLEWGMNIPVLTKLTPNLEIFNKMLTIKVDDPLYAPIVPKYSHITGTIEYLREWMNTKSFCRSKCTMIPPTWRNFIKILKDISPELSQVAYQIKDLFKATEADEDLSKLSTDLVSLQISSSEETIKRGLENGVKLCGQILQKVQQADIEREQAVIQLLFKDKELAELKEQLEATKRAKEECQVGLMLKLPDRALPMLLRQLTNHAAKWRVIGIHLGFLPGELANIEARPSLSQGAPVSWFAAMLEDWLQWAPGDSRGSTSFAKLEDLKGALSEAGLGASTYDLNLQSIQMDESYKVSSVSSVQCEREATGIHRSILKAPRLGTSELMSGDCDSSHASEEVIENNKLREPLLECSDDQQHFIGARSPLNTKPTPPEKKTNQCLLQ